MTGPEPSAGFTPGPYTLAATARITIDGVERAPRKIMRDSDGSLLIMASEPGDFAEQRRIAVVHPIGFSPKRGQGWQMTAEQDAEQWATASLFVSAPDLYAALAELIGDREVGGTWRIDGDAIARARAALAKAEARS